MRAYGCVFTFWCTAFIALTSAQDADRIAAVLQYATENKDLFLSDLKQFVKYPTISAFAQQHKEEFAGALQWLEQKLKSIGFENVQQLGSGAALPSVYADWLHAPEGVPTILLYGHYDVQPAEPLDLWLSPPFEVEERDGYLYGRGVSDCKGTLLQALHGLQSVMMTGNKQLPINVKLFLEGEEEIGSPHLAGILKQHKKLLQADTVICADGGQISETQPGMCLGFRGMLGLEVTLHTLTEDVHSGLWGGTVHNAALALSQLLSTMHTPTGSIAVEGYLRDVRAMTEDDRRDVLLYPWDSEQVLGSLGVIHPHGEDKFTALERTWFRPSIDVVGMYAGHTGNGMKTILPASATAKLSSRIVPDQDPEQCMKLLTAHLQEHKPSSANLTITKLGVAWPYAAPRDSFSNRAAAQVLESVMGAPPLFERSGGTIPALTTIKQVLGVDTTVFAFGLNDNKIHAPNERFSVSFYHLAVEAYIKLLFKLRDSYTTPTAAEQQERKDEL